MIIETGLFVFYVSLVMLFEEKDDHVGPLTSKNKTVYRKRTGHIQPVSIFDKIRRVIFNPYETVIQDATKSEVWVVNEDRMEYWSCPICLSFWTSFLISIPLFLQTHDMFNSILLHFASAGLSSILHYMVSYVQMPTEEKEESSE